MSEETPIRFRFGPFELDPRAGELFKSGVKLRVSGQPIEILGLLLAQPGEAVTREELRRTLWPENTFVDFDHGLSAAVNKLREALADSADAPLYVETLPRRGYRFIAPVERLPHPAAEPAPPPPAAAARSKPRLPSWLAFLAAAAAALIVSLAAGWLRRDWEPHAEPPIRSLAVLPFASLARDVEQESLSDGMTEALITRLSQIQALRVVSRTSVMRYRGAQRPLPEIARELGVDAVVEGTVQRAGGRVSISAKLVEAASDRNLWAASYERELADVLALQAEVAQAIADGIRVRVTPQERKRLGWARSVDPEAYQLFLKARYYQNQAVGSATAKAIASFRESIEKDPGYAPAHARLAEALVYGYPPLQTMPRAKEAALRALELAPQLPEAHGALGLVRTFWDWDWGGAEAAFRRGLELDPRSAELHHRYSLLLAATGRFDEAIEESRRALELDPLAPNVAHTLGRIYYFARRYDLAQEQLSRAVEMDPTDYWSNFFLAVVYQQREMYGPAVKQWQRSAGLSGVSPEAVALISRIYEESGYEALMRRMIGWERESTPRLLGSSSIALRLARLGETEEALDWLERSLESHTRDLIYLAVEPAYDPLREDPRFTAMLEKVGLPRR